MRKLEGRETAVGAALRRWSVLAAVCCGLSLALVGCAGSGGLQLPAFGPDTTGSLPNPVATASGQLSEMAQAAGVVTSDSRQRLSELFAIDRRCYTIAARDEVWQAYERAKTEASQPPPVVVSDPWTPENREFYKANCTPEAEMARRQEMRSLHL
jgi:hypothetical protein